MRLVIALGGNALLQRKQSPTADTQRQNIGDAAKAIADIARDHEIVVTHGNGPQIGLLALQAAAYTPVPAYPLDVLGAESEGMIGYVIEQELSTQLPDRKIATLLTQVTVDPADPAFQNPSKPIGPIYEKEDAKQLAEEHGWSIVSDGNKYRRAVPSPIPQAIREISTIRLLIKSSVIVICAGGGGIPVTIEPSGAIRGVEAVIDKDRAAALLATEIGADALLILTDVDAVYADWDTPNARPIRHATPDALSALTFEPGTMGPKVEAASAFVRTTSGIAMIGALTEANQILAGTAGTHIA